MEQNWPGPCLLAAYILGTSLSLWFSLAPLSWQRPALVIRLECNPSFTAACRQLRLTGHRRQGRWQKLAATGPDHSLTAVLEYNSALGAWEEPRVAGGVKLKRPICEYLNSNWPPQPHSMFTVFFKLVSALYALFLLCLQSLSVWKTFSKQLSFYDQICPLTPTILPHPHPASWPGAVIPIQLHQEFMLPSILDTEQSQN